MSGGNIDWAPVVILGHPSPPGEVIPDREPDKNGLVLLRRDWEFLWNQLRSASAVVEYAHRVADGERIALGTEVDRYFDLADRDEHAEPTPMAAWMADAGADQTSGPTLPREPADTADAVGHSVFQRILETLRTPTWPTTNAPGLTSSRSSTRSGWATEPSSADAVAPH